MLCEESIPLWHGEKVEWLARLNRVCRVAADGSTGQWEPHAKFKPAVAAGSKTLGLFHCFQQKFQAQAPHGAGVGKLGEGWWWVIGAPILHSTFPMAQGFSPRDPRGQQCGNRHLYHIMLLEPPVGSGVSHAMGLAAPIFKLSTERPSICLASCPSHSHVRDSTTPQRDPTPLLMQWLSWASHTLLPMRGYLSSVPLQTLRSTEVIFLSAWNFSWIHGKSKWFFIAWTFSVHKYKIFTEHILYSKYCVYWSP